MNLEKLFGKSYEPFQVKATPMNTCYTVTINEEFREVQQFAEIVNVLENAQQGDYVIFKMSTIGGALHAIIPLITALRNTEAQTAMQVESDTASAGTMLMMLVDEVLVNEYATVMFHNVQYGAYGHGGNVEAQVRHITAGSKKLIRDVYKDFLTEEEIARIELGLEIYLTPEECHDRFKMREELRVQRMIAQQEDEEAETAEMIRAMDDVSRILDDMSKMPEQAPVKQRKTRKKVAKDVVEE